MRNYHEMSKIYKVITTATLTAMIGLSQFGAIQAQEGVVPSHDEEIVITSFAVKEALYDIQGHPYEASIQKLFDQGVLRGHGNGIFAPDQALTMAQAVQMMVNLFDLNLDTIRFIKEPQATDYFVHADDEAWYEEAFIIASVYGLPFKAEIDPKALVSVSELANYIIESGRLQGTPYEIYLDYEASEESISRGQAADFLAHAFDQIAEQQEAHAAAEVLASQFESELLSEVHETGVDLTIQ